MVTVHINHLPDTILFCGREDGEWYRQVYDLDSKDLDNEQYVLVFPKDTMTLTSSFVRGMFEESVNLLTVGGVMEKYKFDGVDRWMVHEDLRYIGEFSRG